MADTISVKITADVVDLQAKFAVAKAESQALTAELNKLARQAAQGGMTDALKAELDKAAEAALNAKVKVASLGAQLKESQGGVQAFSEATGVAREALGALGVSLSAGAIVEFGKAAFDAAAHIEHESQVLGLTSTAYQVFVESARLAGVETETVDSTLRKFNNSLGAAQEGTTAQAKAFRELGVNASLPAQDALPAIARALLDMTDKAEKARLETVLFGRAGQELNPALEQWAQGTDDLKGKLSDLGTILSPEVTKAAEDAHIKLDTAFKQFQTSYTPAVISLTDAFTDLLTMMGKANVIFGAKMGGFPANPDHGATGSFGDAPPPPPTPKPNPAVATEQNEVARLVDLDVKLAEREKLTKDIATAQQTLNDAQARGDSSGTEKASQAVADLQKQLDGLNKSPGASKAANQAREIADQILQSDEKLKLGRVENEQETDQALASLGKESETALLSQELDLANRRYAIEKDYLTKKAAEDSGNKVAYQKDLTELAQLDQQYANKKIQLQTQAALKQQELDRKETDDTIKALDDRLSEQQRELANEAEHYQISAEEKGTIEKQLVNNILGQELALVNAKIALYAKDTQQYAYWAAQKQKIEHQLASQITTINTQTSNTEIAKWKQVSSAIVQSFGTAIRGMITGSMTLKQALGTIAEGILDAFLQMGERMLENWIESLIAQAIETKTVGGESALDQIITASGIAGANAYASTAAIPYIGPELAPAAAALAMGDTMAFASLIAFDVGTNYVPNDMVAQVHQGERIIPAADNAALMRMMHGGGNGGEANGGGIHLNYSPTINNGNGDVDINSILQKHGNELLEWLGRKARNGTLQQFVGRSK
jgi:hypothetical protein